MTAKPICNSASNAQKDETAGTLEAPIHWGATSRHAPYDEISRIMQLIESFSPYTIGTASLLGSRGERLLSMVWARITDVDWWLELPALCEAQPY